MMKSTIIFYDMKGLRQEEKNQIREELFGITQYSNYGKYKYEKKGALQKIPHVKPTRSAIIVKEQDAPTLTKILRKHHAKYKTYPITLNKKELSY